MKAISTLLLLVLLAASSPTALAAASTGSAQLETPDFGSRVLIFDPSMTDMQSRIDDIFHQQERSQFGSNRFALRYASYKVTDTVTTHEAWGLGVYCVFYAAPVVAENAIETATAPGVKMHHMVTIRLGGRPNSGISHVINGQGSPVITARKAVVD